MQTPVDTIRRVLGQRASRRAALGGIGVGGLAAAAGGGRRVVQAQATPTAAADDLPSFKFELEAAPATEYAAGLVRTATAAEFPTLSGLAMFSERIDPGGLRELHWHANANEINYCLRGQGEMAIFTPDGALATFPISPGSVSFAPMGFTHYIRNTGSEPLRLVLVFTHERPATVDLSTTLPVVPRNLLAETFGVAADAFPAVANRGDQFIVPSEAPAGPAPAASPGLPPKPYTVNISQVEPASFLGGTIHTLGPEELPKLVGVTVWPLHGAVGSLREPHWHPNASELNYCISGTAQIGLTSPSGKQQTFAMGAGDIAFLPENWFHYIASTGDQPLEFLVFFSDPRPQHIDLSQTVGVFPPEIFAASFGIDPREVAALPKRGDVLLAGRGANATPTVEGDPGDVAMATVTEDVRPRR